jgi:protocatechuate 3,4-dioxygenase beta subunit
MHTSLVLMAGLVAAASAWPVAQQARDAVAAPPSVGSGSISGAVTDTSGHPLRKVTVFASPTGRGGGFMTVSDDSGRFTIGLLPDASYSVNAMKVPYLNASYGAKPTTRVGEVATPTPVAVANGQHVENINIQLRRGAVITGTITDESGRPASHVSVMAGVMSRSYMTGEMTLIGFGGPAARVLTDSHGVYRIYGLMPGQFAVGASPSNGRVSDVHVTSDAALLQATTHANAPPTAPAPVAPAGPVDRGPTVAYVPIYYPGTPNAADATFITLAEGEEKSGIDFRVSLVPTSNVSGTVMNPDGSPAPNITVRPVGTGLSMSGLDTFGVFTAVSTSDAKGHFNIGGLAPGPYSIFARSGNGRGGGAMTVGLWAQANVTMTGQPLTTDLRLQSGFTLTGRLVLDHKPETVVPQDLSQARINLQAVVTGGGAQLGVPAVTADATGSFTVAGIVPGRYRILATVPPGRGGGPATAWMLRSASVNGQDAADLPIDIQGDLSDAVITMTDRQTQLSGRMLDASGQPALQYYMILFSADATYWTPQSRRIQMVRPGRDGTFTFRNIPAGDYRLAAVTDVEQGEWFDPAFLKPLATSSLAVKLVEGETTTQDVRIR